MVLMLICIMDKLIVSQFSITRSSGDLAVDLGRVERREQCRGLGNGMPAGCRRSGVAAVRRTRESQCRADSTCAA
jgi:hypothetical protein